MKNINDPRNGDERKTSVSFNGNYPEVAWRVEGWTEDPAPEGFTPGCCSYADSGSQQAAELAIARMKVEGDYTGRKFQHYDVCRLTCEVTAVQKTFAVGEEES